MEPDVVERGPINLLGFGFFGDPFRISAGWTEENEIGRLWQRFMAYVVDHPSRIQHASASARAFEVHIEHEETARTGEYEVFVGLEVERLEDMPVQLTAKVLPPATYAVFTLQGEQITSDWHSLVIAQWMAKEGYESAHPFGFQRYDERFKGLDQIEDSVLEAWVPIRRAFSNRNPSS
jgi:predicted transcriptional regulator YdeE